ncbi:hypothetical protein PV721_30385 [Streptomyces sp. MB09-01]|uniref:hypothetical protein n=1 Tax=Streptomyces sp. MB09-01 TaxID=3028666 RepID=UPI0029BA2C42|nr:hypothetical protein [Streptomyces sp. MB09-01]MDX3538578.1 hypothetical protein [Streptomyces sp. MB09-01]
MDDIEGAVAALDRSVQRILDRDPAMTGRPATALRESARDIRTRMLGEGRAAVEQGERWSAEVGEVRVLLIPRDDDSLA